MRRKAARRMPARGRSRYVASMGGQCSLVSQPMSTACVYQCAPEREGLTGDGVVGNLLQPPAAAHRAQALALGPVGVELLECGGERRHVFLRHDPAGVTNELRQYPRIGAYDGYAVGH